MGSDIYQTLKLWARLSSSNYQSKKVAGDCLPNEEDDSESEQGIEGVVGKVSMPGNVVKEA